MKSLDVLISGAGVAGPALAFWLLRWGFRPTLIEQASHLRTDGYVIDFWGVGYDVAERMGILPRLHTVGYQVDAVRLVDRTGRRVGGFGGRLFRSATRDRFVSLPRGDLAREIFRTIENRVEVIFGDSIRAIRDDGSGVEVAFGRSPPRRFDLVVGADGMHSSVRALLFGEDARFFRYLGYGVAAFTSAGYPHRDENAYVSYAAPGRQIGRFALRDGRTAFFLIFTDKDGLHVQRHDHERQRRLLRRTFDDAGWEAKEVLAALDDCATLYFDAVSQVRLDKWSKGRVVLLGDAGFCPSLLAGQGAALAMTGAYVLAGELWRAAGDHAIGFDRYEQRLRPLILAKQKSAGAFGRWLAPRTERGIWLRNQLTRLIEVPYVSDLVARRMVDDRLTLPAYDG